MEPSSRSLTIDALAAGGRGVARPEGGKVWLVSGAVPGDVVEAQVVREHRNWVAARVTRRIASSPDRREPPCPLQGSCGGCPWMALPEGLQRQWKSRLVADALARIGGVDDVRLEPLQPSPCALGWRNRVEFTVGATRDGAVAVGLHRADGDGIVDVSRCLLQADAANAALVTARALIVERWPAGAAHAPARLVLRGNARDELLVVVREERPTLRDLAGFADALIARHPQVVGVVRVRARPGGRGGATCTTLAGRDWIEESLGGVTFRLPAATFVQVNAGAAAGLLDGVVEAAGEVGGREVLDVYGGVGAFGIALAGRGARVTVADADGDAVRCGRDAARRAGRKLAFVRADARRFLEREQQAHRRPHLVVANPPRTGCGTGVAEALGALAPPHLIVVSCDPATLARDVKRLLASGYRLRRAVPFDLFPQTAHVETLLVLER